jgi:hypothetical protein
VEPSLLCSNFFSFVGKQFGSHTKDGKKKHFYLKIWSKFFKNVEIKENLIKTIMEDSSVWFLFCTKRGSK